MEKQMNVVALYSIKDAKPFYYISSAEARIAIDYINLCREFKTNIVKDNMDTITTFVKNIDVIIGDIKKSNFEEIPSVIVWQSGLVLEDKNLETISWSVDASSSITSISKQVCFPLEIHGIKTILQKFSVDMRSITDDSVKRIINAHLDLTLLHGYSHYIICGSESKKLEISSRNLPNMTEREIFQVKNKYDSQYGTLPVFYNNKIAANSIIIVSRSINGDKSVVISEYSMNKVEYN
jgi:hypothetical protein